MKNLLFKSLIQMALTLACLSVSSSYADEPFALKETMSSIAQTQIAVYKTPLRQHTSSGLFVYTHGMTSRVNYHLNLLKAVYDAGFDVVAYDLPGHGHSERKFGLKGGVEGFDQMLKVLDGVIQEGKVTFGQKKVFLSGWSLGGLITSVYLQKHPDIAGTVLYAPGISLGIAHGDLSILGGIKPENLVHNEELAATLRNDEGFFRFPPPCLMTAVLTGEYESNPKEFKTKTLLFTAGEDYFVSNQSVLNFYEDAHKINGIELKTYHYPNSRHDLENDVDSASVLKNTIDFLKQDIETRLTAP